MRIVIGVGLVLALATSTGEAAVFKVGPGGTHATIQAAVDDALAAGGTNEVRVAEGSYSEDLRIETDSASTLRLTGGWSGGFVTQGGVTTLTGTSWRVVKVRRTAGAFELSGFTIVGGASTGGVYIHVAGTAGAVLRDNVIRDCHWYPDGGGLWAVVGSSEARLLVARNLFEANGFIPLDAAFGSYGGGAFGATCPACPLGALSFLDNIFLNNETPVVAGADPQTGLALYAGRSVVRRNQFRGTRGSGPAVTLAGGEASGNVIDSNFTPVQLRVVGPIRVTDTLVARGSENGVAAYSWDGGDADLVNLTVTQNAGQGLTVDSTAGRNVRLSNSIVYGNAGGDLVGTLDAERNNLIGIDPGFVDYTGGDFHLAPGPGSPAIDGGNPPVSGLLGTEDIDGETRVMGPKVDIGADEVYVPPPPPPPPICHIPGEYFPGDPPVCVCFHDPGHLETFCRTMPDVPDLEALVRIPWRSVPSQPVEIRWTVTPKIPVNGQYGVKTDAKIGTQWLPQTRLGPGAPMLVPGQPVIERFRVQAPGLATPPLRTQFTYRRGNQPRTLTLEITPER